MSRLHECKSKGLDKVQSEPHWASIYPTVEDRASDLYLKAVKSVRAGTRTKTKRKTAQACGHGFEVTSPWKVRNSGIISTKSKKQKDLKKAAKIARETMQGDAKKHDVA